MAAGLFTLSFSPEQLEDLQARVNELSNIEQDDIVRSGLRKAASYLIAQGKISYKANRIGQRHKTPKGVWVGPSTGAMGRSWIKQLKKRSKKFNNWTSGIKAGFERPAGAPAHLIDRGTTERYTKKGYYRGKVTANSFWTDVRETSGDKALEMVFSGIYDAVDRLGQGQDYRIYRFSSISY